MKYLFTNNMANFNKSVLLRTLPKFSREIHTSSCNGFMLSAISTLAKFNKFVSIMLIVFLFSFGEIYGQYCPSNGTTTYSTGTTLVQFESINNTSTKPSSGDAYTDYTGTETTNVTQGQSYNLTVNVNTDGNYTVHTLVWIDWNKNDVFTDSGEEYDLGDATNTTDGVTSNSPLSISVPAGASVGATVMRVSSKYDADPTSSCEEDFDGEVEDYEVVVQSSTTSTLSSGATSEPGTISSMVNTSGASVSNFDFVFLEDGATPATDGTATQISQIVINQGTGNDIVTWTDVILGAELNDGTNSMTGTINSDNITFTSIPNASGQLGYVVDDDTKTYVLKVWFKTSLGGSLPLSIDGQNLVFLVETADLTFDAGGLSTGQSVNSGSTKNAVEVTATILDYEASKPPSNVPPNTNFKVTVNAVDGNGNLDLDATCSTTLAKASGTGILSSTIGLTQSLVSGTYSWTDVQYDTEETFTIEAQCASITNVTSGDITCEAISYCSRTGDFGTTYDWVDCSGETAMALTDNNTEEFNWPFDFNFYGTDYTTTDEISVCSNGFIRFDGIADSDWSIASDFTLESGSTELGQMIALGVYDCYATGAVDAKITYLETGVDPNRILTIEFAKQEIDANDGLYATLQVQLYETSNKIVIFHKTNNITQTGVDVGIHSGVAGSFEDWQDVDEMTDNTWMEFGQTDTPADPADPTYVKADCTNNQTLKRDGNPAADIEWFWQGTNSSGTSTSSNATSDYTASSTGTYYIRARKGGCWSAGSGSLSVIVDGVTADPANPSSGGGCGNQTLTSAVNGTSNDWYWQGTTSLGTSTANNATSTYEATTTDTYYIRAKTGSCWSVGQGSIVVTMATLPADPGNPTSDNVCGNQELTSSSSEATWYWQGTTSAGTGTGDGNGTDTYPATTTGTYYIRAFDESCWSANSGSVAVNTSTAAPTGSNTITGSIDVDANSTGNTYSSDYTDADSYTWTVPSGATITNGQGLSTITVTFGTSSGNVSCTATRGNCDFTINLAVTVDTRSIGKGVYIIQDFTNNGGTFIPNTTTMVFNGIETQNITSTTNCKFNNVIIDNSKANNTEITLADNITIQSGGKLSFVAGIINTGAFNFVFEDGAESSVGNANCFIDGAIIKGGDDAFTFPTGDVVGGVKYWAPIGIVAPTVSSDKITAEYNYASPEGVNGAAAPWNSLDTGISGCSGKEYWKLETTGTNYPAVTLYWKNHTASDIITAEIDELTIAHWDSDMNMWQNIGGTGTSDGGDIGHISSSLALSSYSPFTFAAKTKKLPFPIELLYFTANPNTENTIDLNWSTASELNNDYFTIERSIDAINFEFVDVVPAYGTSNEILYYDDIDENPYEGISYYRLKQTDYNGVFTYSDIVSVTIKNDEVTIDNIYPIPVVDDVSVSINSISEININISVTNNLGQVLYSEKEKLLKGKNTIKIPTKKYALGSYFLKITSDNTEVNMCKMFFVGQK